MEGVSKSRIDNGGNKMGKKLLLILALSISHLFCFAQVQQGFVRTAGKPHQKGQPLGGVSIKVSGSFNAVKSDDPQGTFSIPMKDYKDGAGFTLQSVYKSGYELTDRDFLSRKHSFSTQVPLEIVMISRADIVRVQTEIEDRARATAEKKYHARLDELNKELDARKISEEHYRKELADLQRKQESFDALIATMAERYARTDYDKLDSLNKAINICIVEGNLDKADSLINSKGSIEQRIASLREQEQTLHEAKEELRKAEVALAEGEKEKERRKEEIAEDLYNKHSIALSHFEVDSAGYFMELRAELDTMNADYQNEAGKFMIEYRADYSRAMIYCQRVLHTQDERSRDVTTSYNNIGTCYSGLGDYVKAMEFHNKSLQIRQKLFGESHPKVAISYNNMGTCYSDLGNYVKALEFHNKSLQICQKLFGESHPNIATSYNNIGVCYHLLSKYAEALKYYNSSLLIYRKFFGDDHPSVMNLNGNIARTYKALGDSAKAAEYSVKAGKVQDAKPIEKTTDLKEH